MGTVSAMRPGVYASYAIVGGQSGRASGAVGVIARCGTGEVLAAKRFTRLADVQSAYGRQVEGGMLTALAGLLFAGGAGEMYCVSVGTSPTQQDYLDAYALLDGEQAIKAVVCDADNTQTQKALGLRLKESASRSRERIGYFGASKDLTAEQIAQAAQEINCERVCMLAPAVHFTQGQTASAAYLAAAACAAVMKQSDPAANLNLLELAGEMELPAPYTEAEITLLLNAGVTVAERAGAGVRLIRAMSTRTLEDGVPDVTLRELSTVRIIDDVVPALRDLLTARLRGAKNNAATRDAIRTQTACELEKKQSAGIIDGYQPPVVYPKADDPTVCMVEVAFAVVYGMHRIELTAFITV